MTATTTRNSPSDRQVSFFNSLMSELTGEAYTQGFAESTTRSQASSAISEAIRMRDERRAASNGQRQAEAQEREVQAHYQRRSRVQVANGNYAIDDERNGTAFFRVNTPERGRWEGFTFVDQYASDERYPVRDRARKAAILEAIAADPHKAMLRYGQELGRCGNCNRALTDELSREIGIGPDCRANLGIDSTGARQAVAQRRRARQNLGVEGNRARAARSEDIAEADAQTYWMMEDGLREDENLSGQQVEAQMQLIEAIGDRLGSCRDEGIGFERALAIVAPQFAASEQGEVVRVARVVYGRR